MSCPASRRSRSIAANVSTRSPTRRSARCGYATGTGRPRPIASTRSAGGRKTAWCFRAERQNQSKGRRDDMKDRFSTTSQVELTRRDLLKSAAVAGGAAALAPVLGGIPTAQAADVVRGYGVTTAQLKDWSIMEKAIGIKMEFTGTDNSVGVFMRDVAGSQLGDKVDIFIFESGTEDILGPQGMYLVIDEKNPELTLWDRSPNEWKHSEVVMGKDGKQYGVPVIGNADSFGYFPAAIGANPDGTDDISWAMFFESDKTRGKA